MRAADPGDDVPIPGLPVRLARHCRPNRVKTERPSPDVDIVDHAWTERVILSILTIPARVTREQRGTPTR